VSGRLRVLRPGPHDTVQDLGRHGYRAYGMPSSGAADWASLVAGNLLVGNPPTAAALESTLVGPVLRVEGGEVFLAVTGAPCTPRVDGSPVPCWTVLCLRPGQTLKLGSCHLGCRMYVCVAGGIETPEVMESRSTYVPGEIGGLDGRKLAEGDCLPVGMNSQGARVGRTLRPEFRPQMKEPWTLRAVRGPDDDAFLPESVSQFFSGTYRVSPASDRMGCRLEGPVLRHAGDAEIVSEGVIPGTVQVPGSGLPMLLLSDCQTTGGYPRIATVIRADMWAAGQLRPGDAVRFCEVSVEQAVQAERRMLGRLARGLGLGLSVIRTADWGFRVWVEPQG